MTKTGPRRLSYMVAMDAIHFTDPKLQYTKRMVDRELNKAFVAFLQDAEYENIKKSGGGAAWIQHLI